MSRESSHERRSSVPPEPAGEDLAHAATALRSKSSASFARMTTDTEPIALPPKAPQARPNFRSQE